MTVIMRPEVVEFEDEHHGIRVRYSAKKGLIVQFGASRTDKRRVHVWVHQRRKKAAIVELYEADGKEKPRVELAAPDKA